MRKVLLVALLASILFSSFGFLAIAHSGRTDSNGGHYESSTGKYHYHHGYSAHQHNDIDGDGKRDCPYDFKNAKSNYKSSKSKDATFGDILKIIGLSVLCFFVVGMPIVLFAYMALLFAIYIVFDLLLLKLLEKIFEKEFRPATDVIENVIKSKIFAAILVFIAGLLAIQFSYVRILG